MSLAIHIEGLKKTYANGTEALAGINLKVPEGEFFALLGANGAGKTTIIGILTGLVNKTSGTAKIFGHDIVSESALARKMIGVVPQEMNFNMFENVQDIIVNQAGYYGIDRKTAIKESEGLLRKVELWNQRNHPSKSLSGGMKRRLMLARALINKPKLLILDEPTAGVDVELRHSLWQYLIDLNKGGLTILLTTHYLEEVEQLCQRAAIIKKGEIITDDSVRNLVKLVESETYLVHVDKIKALESLNLYQPKKIDDQTFEVDLPKSEKIGDIITKITALGMIVDDIRPKGNRLEKLFLNILKQ